MPQIPYSNRGIASGASEEFTSIELITGDYPIFTTTETVPTATVASAALPKHSVVGRDGTGKIVLATAPDVTDPIPPIGITTEAVPAGLTNPTVPMYRSGCFNPAALNWDASFNTSEKKRIAFEPSGLPIFIREAYTG